MINRITGILTGRSNDAVYVSTGGIEWDIAVPLRASALFGPVGEKTEVYVWLQHYDDGMKLFGFPSERERGLFFDLMKVDGIGPRQALKILSGIAPPELTAALETGNLGILQKISGVGPKLAQKMVLALKGKLIDLVNEGGEGTQNSSPWSDVVTALVDMGFDRKAAEASVRARASEVSEGQEGERELFRMALIDLSAGVGASRK